MAKEERGETEGRRKVSVFVEFSSLVDKVSLVDTKAFGRHSDDDDGKTMMMMINGRRRRREKTR